MHLSKQRSLSSVTFLLYIITHCTLYVSIFTCWYSARVFFFFVYAYWYRKVTLYLCNLSTSILLASALSSSLSGSFCLRQGITKQFVYFFLHLYIHVNIRPTVGRDFDFCITLTSLFLRYDEFMVCAMHWVMSIFLFYYFCFYANV